MRGELVQVLKSGRGPDNAALDLTLQERVE